MLRSGLALALAGSALAGCGGRESKLDEVRAAISATRRDAAQFVYVEERDGAEHTVTGVIDDDFRYKALVAVDGAPEYEEIVVDDALAMRLHIPENLPKLVDRDRLDSADLSTDVEGANVLQVLNSKRWVIDPEGAPAATTSAAADTELGRDLVYDALTSLDYVDTALTQAIEVAEYRADALNPVYPRTEDVFPAPEAGSGVVRYDLRRGRLPAISQQAGNAGGRQAVPNVSHFRKMAIYVKDGRILRVLERIEVIGKFVEDLRNYLEGFVAESRIGDDLVAEFKAIERLGNTPEAGNQYLEFLNTVIVGLGGDPVIGRTMTLEFSKDKGDVTEVVLPTADVVQGSLEVMLASRAAKTGEDTTGEAPPPDAGTTDSTLPLDPTATTVPGAPGDPGATTPTGDTAPPPG